MQIINQTKSELDKTIEYLKNELRGLQVGRATPNLVENLEVDCYERRMPLKQIASIQVPESRVIIISPWDKSIIQNIEKAIRQSRLGINPIVEEDLIRLSIPMMSEERRKELVKIVSEKVEECRINIRRHREDTWKKIQGMEQNGEISEDDKFRSKDELQKVVEEYNKKVEEMKDNKEKEIMKV
ncbi:ribosome recycling factor [Patescibacteria group bacterium]